MVEPVIGTLKQQRGMRQFLRRGLRKVGQELLLAAISYNLTRSPVAPLSIPTAKALSLLPTGKIQTLSLKQN